MSFFKFQNFSNRVVNIEVPLVTDPRTNVLQTLYSQSNDELWVESWLQQNCIYRPLPKTKLDKSNAHIPIHEAQQSLNGCLIILDKLAKTQQDLQHNVATMSSAEWKQKTIEIGILKDQFTKLMSNFESGDGVFTLKKSIDKRRKKRINQRKRKEFRRQQMELKLQNREKLHKSTDRWLQNEKEGVEKVKMEEDMKKDADCVLAEVTKKKSDARKQLSLMMALNNLRTIRDQILVQRGERVSLEDKSAFNITLEKLNKMWESAFRTYTKEEQGLKLMLEKTASDDSKTARIAKERKLLEEWHTIFFGHKQLISQDNSMYWALTAAERDMETFIAIRKSWDTFLVSPTNEMGSKIPFGWVLPDSDPNENWLKYLSLA